MKSPNEFPKPMSALAAHVGALRAEVAALEEADAEPLSDTLAGWLAAHYAAAARQAEADGHLDLKTLRALTADVVALRKGDHSAKRLEQEREWLQIEHERWDAKQQDQIEAALRALAEQIREKPGARAAFDKLRDIVQPPDGPRLSEQERAQRLREIFGLPRMERRGLSPETLAEIERAANLL